MSSENAKSIYDALDQRHSGNFKCVQATDEIVVIANRTLYHQNNSKGAYAYKLYFLKFIGITIFLFVL